jgi:HlyD family secretion protein
MAHTRSTTTHDGTPATTDRSVAGDALVISAPSGARTPVSVPIPAPRARRWPRTLKKALIAGVVVLVATVVGVHFFQPPLVTVAPVTTRDIAPAVQGVGTIEAKIVVDISSKVLGRVISVLVDQGDPIRAGQVLARVDDAQMKADVDRNEANVRTAEAQLNDLLAGPRPQELEQLRARLASATATRANAERDYQRSQALYAKELVSAQDLDHARQASDVASATERDVHQALDLAMQSWARKDQIDAARAQLRAAQSALALSRANLGDTVIVSPLDGYVVSRNLEAGGIVNPGTPIFKIADPRTAWAVAYVDQRDTSGLAVGDRADVTLRSLPGRTFTGRLARIEREGDRVTEQLTVDVAFVERPARLILGEQVEAVIWPPVRRDVAAVPIPAMVRGPQGAGALVVENGRLHFAPVRFGAVDRAGWVEVLDGLRPGTEVVIAPGPLADRANEGRRIRVAPAAAP